jgi:hypothetical protein
VRGKLVQQRPNVVDEARMIARKALERNQRRPAAGGALVVEAAPQELGLLAVPELADRAIGDRALPVVRRPGRALELVLPLRPQLCELALGALLRERGRLGSG